MKGGGKNRPAPTGSALQRALLQEAEALGLSAPPLGWLRGVGTHLELLFQWNQKYNLTAIRDPLEAIRRHALEAWEAVSHLATFPTSCGLADLGSGNGFPSIPLLLAHTGKGFLFETRSAKAAFLRAVLRETGLLDRVEVREARFSDLLDLPSEVGIVTLRGFPEPLTWVQVLPSAPQIRGILAWLSIDDARLAQEQGNPAFAWSTHPLTTHPSGVVLVGKRR